MTQKRLRTGWAARTPTFINICLVGNGSFTEEQERTFDERARYWMQRLGLPASAVKGHKEFPGQSTNCPGIDMNLVRARLAGQVADTSALSKNEKSDLKFTSGTLRKEFETFLGSKAQREIAVKAAVEAGYSEKWIKVLGEGRAADGDIVMLGLGALIRANK
ncbi:N-acetylmuramoyl-L-alanine amidase [Sporosarcina sp. 179-K 3D1 HS]|uniref:peptidoglycan recognition protein family protein n=1 Tax=Sporosarcina sp. 179-K 3D1 HS TaxID=3232169 RepID=UPI0039A17381